MSYKLPLLKAYPNEMKELNAYAYLLKAKFIVDDPQCIGFTKDITDINGIFVENVNVLYPEVPEAEPPEGVKSFGEFKFSIATENNLDSKKAAVLKIHQWMQKLIENLYQNIRVFKFPENALPEEQENIAILSTKD